MHGTPQVASCCARCAHLGLHALHQLSLPLEGVAGTRARCALLPRQLQPQHLPAGTVGQGLHLQRLHAHARGHELLLQCLGVRSAGRATIRQGLRGNEMAEDEGGAIAG